MLLTALRSSSRRLAWLLALSQFSTAKSSIILYPYLGWRQSITWLNKGAKTGCLETFFPFLVSFFIETFSTPQFLPSPHHVAMTIVLFVVTRHFLHFFYFIKKNKNNLSVVYMLTIFIGARA